MNARIIGAVALSVAIGAGTSGAAFAAPINPNPNHVKRTWSPSVVVVERTWTPRPEQVWRPTRTWHRISR